MGEAGKLINDRGLRTSTYSSDSKHIGGGSNRNWDDEFVLKHQLPALIPAFDPRPGRTNVNQVFCVSLMHLEFNLTLRMQRLESFFCKIGPIFCSFGLFLLFIQIF